MHRFIRPLAVTIVSGLVAAVLPQATAQTSAIAQMPAVGQLASDQLKVDAFSALRKGDFDRSGALLKQAAQNSSDPSLELMASWVASFSTQYDQTLAGRKAEHDKAVSQTNLLLSKSHIDYALESLARAHSLALDKKAFRNEPWVNDIIKARAEAAAAFEQSGEYHNAVRIYLSLAGIDQADPAWKSKLKSAARYVRIQALYAPGYFRGIQQTKQKEDDKIDELLADAGLTRSSATSKPTSRPADDEDTAMIDWREVLKGIDFDMITEAARDAVRNYYREVDYTQIATGGLEALRILATTPQISTQFQPLGEPARRSSFVEGIDRAMARASQLKAGDYAGFKSIVNDIRELNKSSVNLPENVLVYEFMDGGLEELDQFSSMIWPQQIEEFTSATQGEFSGVGIQIERAETGDIKVVSPIEDTPAYRAGIKAGDMITRINGELAKGMMLDQAVKKIKGKTGTRVTLTVRSPDGASVDHSLKRDTIKVASIKGWKRMPGGGWDWVVDPVQRVGYVRLTNFSKTSADDLRDALDDMEKQGIRGVVLDLRSDPGGLLNIAEDISDMFLNSGTIVSTRADREAGHSPTETKADPSGHKYRLPMVVLVNQYSASASEIVSGALKDHHRAVIVGERTFGKGSVQMLFPLAGKMAALKLTTSRYYLPSGRCLHREETSTEWGVDPDFTIEMTPEQMRQAIEARTQMDVLWGPTDQPRPTATTKPANLLDVDPQLSAAVMLMRLQIAGVKLQG